MSTVDNLIFSIELESHRVPFSYEGFSVERTLDGYNVTYQNQVIYSDLVLLSAAVGIAYFMGTNHYREVKSILFLENKFAKARFNMSVYENTSNWLLYDNERLTCASAIKAIHGIVEKVPVLTAHFELEKDK